MPALNPPASQKTLYSIQQELKSGFKNLCCKLDDYEYIPVYEFLTIETGSYSGSTSSSLYYEIFSGTITFNQSADVFSYCSGDTLVLNDYIQSISWMDSLGMSGNSLTPFEPYSPFSIDYSKFSSKEVTLRIRIQRSSGFTQVMDILLTIDSSSEISFVESTFTYTNSNTSNSTSLGYAGVKYEIMVADILEVRKNGAFVKYVDLSHNDYTPTYCLSYNPVMPFTSLDVPELKVNYDEVEYLNLVTPLSILPDTVHTISILSHGGKTDISIDGGLAATLLDGQSITFPFSTLNKNAIDISPANKAYVSLIKPR
jgi:hypothetical protein